MIKRTMDKIKKQQKGITLIALVVTIIILLILAGVSIAMLTGNNGVLTQAKSAKEKTGEKGEQERVNLAASSAMTLGMGTITTENLNKAIQDEFGAEKSVTGTGPWTYQGEYAKYKIEKAGTVAIQKPLPKTAEGQAKGTQIENPASYGENPTAQATADGEGKFFAKPNDATYEKGTVDTGVVIRDKNQNEWVWVPVDDATLNQMYQTAEGTALAGDTGVTTNKYSKGNIIDGIDRGTPNSTSWREPDILTDKDTDDTAIQAGFTAKEAKTALKVMAENLVQDYSDMIESITKYKGFYIGRYELSTKTENGKTIGIEQKDKISQTETSWYELYKYSKNIAGSENMQTRMIWGCQWDVTCKWLEDHNYDINNSSAWGNYSNYNTANNYAEGSEKYEAGAGEKQETGSSENWKANNIYDLAGNCYEWTQEAVSTDNRACRGGGYGDNGYNYPASYRGYSYPDYSSVNGFASRASLYIK